MTHLSLVLDKKTNIKYSRYGLALPRINAKQKQNMVELLKQRQYLDAMFEMYMEYHAFLHYNQNTIQWCIFDISNSVRLCKSFGNDSHATFEAERIYLVRAATRHAFYLA